MKVTIPGYGTLAGKPATILRLMQDARMFDQIEGDEYIAEVARTAWRAFGIGLQVAGETYAERAESLLREMNRNHMLTIEEE